MRLAQLPFPLLQLTKIRTVKRTSLEKNVIAEEMKRIAIVNAIESESAKENVTETETAKIARKVGAEAEARGKTITKEHALPHHQATRNVIMEKEAIILREIILSFIKLTPLVNNGQKMPPKLKIPIGKINQPL